MIFLRGELVAALVKKKIKIIAVVVKNSESQPQTFFSPAWPQSQKTPNKTIICTAVVLSRTAGELDFIPALHRVPVWC